MSFLNIYPRRPIRSFVCSFTSIQFDLHIEFLWKEFCLSGIRLKHRFNYRTLSLSRFNKISMSPEMISRSTVIWFNWTQVDDARPISVRNSKPEYSVIQWCLTNVKTQNKHSQSWKWIMIFIIMNRYRAQFSTHRKHRTRVVRGGFHVKRRERIKTFHLIIINVAC